MDPDFSGSDSDFQPIRIRTQEKKVRSGSGKKTRIRNTGQKRTKHTNKSIIQRSKAVSDIVHLVLEELVLECLLPGVGAGPLKALLVLAIVIRHLSHLHEKEGCFKSCDSVNLKASYPSSWLSLARKHSMA